MFEDWAKERLEKEEEGRLRGALEGCGASSRGTSLVAAGAPLVQLRRAFHHRRAPRVLSYGLNSCEASLKRVFSRARRIRSKLPRFDEEIRERSDLVVNNSYVVSNLYLHRYESFALK